MGQRINPLSHISCPLPSLPGKVRDFLIPASSDKKQVLFLCIPFFKEDWTCCQPMTFWYFQRLRIARFGVWFSFFIRIRFSAFSRQPLSSIISVNPYTLIRIQMILKQILYIGTFIPTYYQPDFLYPSDPTRKITRLKPTFFSNISKRLGVFFHFPRKINPFMRSKKIFLPVSFQFKTHQKCIFHAYIDKKNEWISGFLCKNEAGWSDKKNVLVRKTNEIQSKRQ